MRARVWASFACAALSLLAAGCFSPDFGDRGFACGAGGSCPDGYECRDDGFCHRAGSPVDTADAADTSPDASIDASGDGSPDPADAGPGQPDAGSSTDAGDVGPLNDLCSDADLLVAGDQEVGSLSGASDDEEYSCTTGAADVYYGFTLASDRKVTITLGATFDGSLTLLGSDCTTEVVCRDATSLGEQIVVENLAAGSYFVAVESADSGDFTIGYTTEPPIVRPENDGCEGAIELVDGTTRTDDTAMNAIDDTDAVCTPAASGDVVYEFTVPGPDNARATVSVSNAADFDPVLVLHSGSCPGTEIDCAQSSTGGSETLDATNLAPGTYYLWVDAVGAAPTTFDIDFQLGAAIVPPDNDVCTGAPLLTEGTTETGSTTGAADDYELACLGTDSADTVHALSLASDSAVLIAAEPLAPAWDLALSLREDASCETAGGVSCVDGAFGARYVNRPSLPAGDYDVLVDGADGAVGDYALRYETRAPDSSFGYWMFETTGQYETLGTGATDIGISSGFDGDDEHYAVSLPFTFPFFGTDYTQVHVAANGYLTFDTPPGTASDSYNNDCSLDDSTPLNLIAAFWDDLYPPTGGTARIRHETQGTAPHRRFVIEWVDFDIWESAPCQGQCDLLGMSVTQMAILHENGDIELRYGPRDTQGTTIGCAEQHVGCSATIGLRDGSGTDIDEAQCDTATVTEGKVVYFVHPR